MDLNIKQGRMRYLTRACMGVLGVALFAASASVAIANPGLSSCSTSVCTTNSPALTAVSLPLSNLLAEADPAPVKTGTDASDSKDKDDKDAKKEEKKREKALKKELKEKEEEKEKKDKEKEKQKDKDKDKEKDKKKEKDKSAKTSEDQNAKSGKDGAETEKAAKSSKDKIEQDKSTADKSDKTAKTAKKTDGKDSGEDKSASRDAKESVVAVGKSNQTESRGEPVPAFVPDAALISVLKDLSRSLKESEEFAKLEDPVQKAIVEIAQQALQKSLEDPQLQSNRIVEKVAKEDTMPPMSTEAWSSGEIDLGEKNKASLSAVWAKRENGLVNVTIDGCFPDKKAPNGKKIGEFVVILSARSSVENGFDIQSQANVSFWLGKIFSIAVESDSCAAPAPSASADQPKPQKQVSTSEEDLKKKPLVILPAVLTERGRKYLAVVQAIHERNALAAKQEEELIKANLQTTNAAASESEPDQKHLQEAYARALRAVALAELKKMKGAGADETEARDGEDKEAKADSGSAKGEKGAKNSAAADEKSDGREAEVANSSGKGNTAAIDRGAAKATVTANSKGDVVRPSGKAINASSSASGKGDSAADSANVQTTPPDSVPLDGAKGNGSSSASSNTSSNIGSATNLNQFSATGQNSNGQSSSPHAGTNGGVTTIASASMNASNAYGSNAQGNNAQGSTASGVATRLSDITAGAETVAAFRAIRQPSLGAVLIVPERAMAGQSVTISVYDAKRNPESSVELVLNGNTMVTNIDGQISFTIPDDATPGRSLNVGLAARPEITPVTVEVLQPLVIPAEKQQPSIERMTLTGSRSDLLVIDGHNFSGLATNNKISIDGRVQGRVSAASPVQLRVSLPVNLPGGGHIVYAISDGLNSNSSSFYSQAVPASLAPAAVGGDKKKAKPRIN